jgi:hypothetical protein
MSNEHRIFSKGKIGISDKNVIQKVRYNREQLLSKTTAAELNTYLNFGVFPTYAETYIPYYKDGKLVEAPGDGRKYGVGTPGVRSLFNRAGAVILGSPDGDYNIDVSRGDPKNTNEWRIANNVPLMDSPETRRRIRQASGCSIKELVEASSAGLLGQETYAYSDFMYCKYLGKMPNNYMITLRRFPLPVDDYIGSNAEDDDTRIQRAANHASCIGCMITWMGVSGNDLSGILKYSYKMPFKFENSEDQSTSVNADSNNTPLNNIASVFDSTYQKQYMAGYAGNAANAAFGYVGIKGLGDPPYAGLAGQRDEKTKVWGPVDSIRGTYVRSANGLEFEQKMTLTFEYELRSYNGINGRQAMLDLISNILNVTYTTGTFYGGGFKGFGAHQSNVFANLKIFKVNGGFTDYVDAFADDMTTVGNKIKTHIDEKGGIKETLKSLANNLGGMLVAGVLNKLGRPQKGFANALLSPAPIGFWHVTIGNPKHPIMSIGNMIITDCSIEHNGPLGLDDFPTGLKVTVSLDRGKPRDLADIEKLYMQGNDRIYSSMNDKVFDMYKNAELYQQHKKAGTLSSYKPVANIADVDVDLKKETVKVDGLTKASAYMKKYFGTDDAYSIYVPAAEQAYGAGKKKPSTGKNSNIKDNSKSNRT